jgi:hypothetical protein
MADDLAPRSKSAEVAAIWHSQTHPCEIIRETDVIPAVSSSDYQVLGDKISELSLPGLAGSRYAHARAQ